MLSCKEATALVSENLDRELPFWKRLSLRLHVAMCKTCAAYKRQIETLNRLVAGRYRDAAPEGTSKELSADCISRIKATLRAENNQNT